MRMQFKMARVSILAILLFMAGGARSHGADRPLRVAYPAPAGAFLPLWAAQDAGIFKKHGLSVELIAVGSSTRGVAAMVSGDLDILAGGGTVGITAQLQGYTRHGTVRQCHSNFFVFGHGAPFDNGCIATARQTHGRDPLRWHAGFCRPSICQALWHGTGKDVTFVQIGAMPDIVVAVAHGRDRVGRDRCPAKLPGQETRAARARRSLRQRLALCFGGLFRQAQLSLLKITSAWCAL